MQFYTHEQFTTNNQCCLFKQTNLNQEQQRFTNDGLIGIQKINVNSKVDSVRRNQKLLNKKNLKTNLSEQKERINLSKFNSKNITQKQGNLCSQQQRKGKYKLKQQTKNQQNSTNNRNLSLNFSFGQIKNQKYPTTINSVRNKSEQQLQEIQKIQLQGKNLQKNNLNNLDIKNNYYQLHKNLIIYPHQHKDQQFKRVSFNYTTNMNPTNMQVSYYQTNIKPKVSIQFSNPVQPIQIQQLKLIQSVHHKSQINSNFNQASSSLNINVKGIQTLAPTIQTDRNLIQSQSKQYKKNTIKINNSQMLNRQQSKYSESRLTQTLNADFGRKQLKTVQSFYASELSAEQKQEKQKQKKVHESVILIDFFNPPQHMRKQIEKRMRFKNSNFSQYYA